MATPIRERVERAKEELAALEKEENETIAAEKRTEAVAKKKRCDALAREVIDLLGGVAKFKLVELVKEDDSLHSLHWRPTCPEYPTFWFEVPLELTPMFHDHEKAAMVVRSIIKDARKVKRWTTEYIKLVVRVAGSLPDDDVVDEPEHVAISAITALHDDTNTPALSREDMWHAAVDE